MSASSASPPLLQKKTRPGPARCTMRRASSPWLGWRKRLLTWISSPAWRWIAATQCGWQWPSELTAMPEVKSR